MYFNIQNLSSVAVSSWQVNSFIKGTEGKLAGGNL